MYYNSGAVIVPGVRMLRVVARALGEWCVTPRRVSFKRVCETCLPSRRSEAGLSAGGADSCTGQRDWMCASSAAVLSAVRLNVQLLHNFISEEEEAAFLQELEPVLKKKRYEFDHWDDAIHGFRETERLRWAEVCVGVLERLRAAAFPEGSPLLGPAHVLDLDKTGFIKPHVDSVKFCGNTIAGLCLLSDCVMRLVSVENSADRVDLLLQRRALYILRDEARFKFTHEILKDEESFFSGRRVPRHRRISIVCRNLPPQ